MFIYANAGIDAMYYSTPRKNNQPESFFFRIIFGKKRVTPAFPLAQVTIVFLFGYDPLPCRKQALTYGLFFIKIKYKQPNAALHVLTEQIIGKVIICIDF